MTREQRSIQIDPSGDPVENDNAFIPTAVALWRAWIKEIMLDPEMNTDRILRHIQVHVRDHMPNADAPRKRWEEWLAGSYNLLAILAADLQMDPPHAVGIDLLLRKYITDPANHTPPPKAVRQKRSEPQERDSGS